MKKIIFGFIAIIVLVCLYRKDDFIIIPNDSIRIRVISNSNSLDDLYQKKTVKDDLEDYLYNLLSNANDIVNAREIIKNNVGNLDKIIKINGVDNYSINYGNNYFPKKIYKGILYPEGKYESLEIKLGEGNGNNYWCVLFPPLCLIDENKINNDIEYKLYVEKLLKIDN